MTRHCLNYTDVVHKHEGGFTPWEMLKGNRSIDLDYRRKRVLSEHSEDADADTALFKVGFCYNPVNTSDTYVGQVGVFLVSNLNTPIATKTTFFPREIHMQLVREARQISNCEILDLVKQANELKKAIENRLVVQND